MNRWVHDESR
ncbi:Protein of unknown function [Propionibacterium freudenreichii]|nr:Protein of unknown function [Propionibacterium freudenreichii]CEI47726.1 Protein of unknown function [Propionibacterium freudenreichii]